jgi:ABC-type multidrug transport system fused ATPase/permease subunit
VSGILDINNFNNIIKNQFFFYFIKKDNFESIDISNFYLFLLLFFIFKNLFFYLFYIFQARFIALVSTDIANQLYKNFLLAPYKFFIKFNFSENSKNLTHDVSRSVQLIGNINILAKEVTLIFLIIFFIFFINTVFFLIIIFLIILLLLIFRIIYSEKLKFYGNQSQEFVTKQLNRILNSFNFFTEIRIYNLLHFFSEKFKSESFTKEFGEQKSNIIVNIPRLVIEIFIIFLLFLLIKIFSINNLNKELFRYSLLIILILRLIPCVISLNRALFDIKFCNVSLNIFKKKFIESKKNIEIESKNISDFKKNIIFKNINFGYTKNVNIIKNLNFQINKNETVGITGASGSGKTTLILLFLGLLKPRSGQILVDNIQLDKKISLRSKISYAPQDTALVNDSVIRNITFKNKLSDYEINRLNNCIKVSESKNFLNKNFLNRIVEEKGMNFSGGQRKRIGLIRALFFEKDIYIFDEPTNFLDSLTAVKFIRNIKKFLFNKTVLIITHNKNILNNCDKIFIMKKKKLILVKKN